MSSVEVLTWCDRADEVRETTSTAAGRFVVSLLGESIARGHPTRWFGHAPDRERLTALLTSYGEEVDCSPILAAEADLRGVRLEVDRRTADGWRRRLDDDAADALIGPDLGPRHPWHVQAEPVWRRGAAATSSRVTGLHADVALSQLRWVPGSTADEPPGFSDELGLAATMRSVQEFGFTEREWAACAAAEALVAPVLRSGP